MEAITAHTPSASGRGKLVLQTAPAVFSVADTYQIMVPVNCETLMWIKVGEQCFYDHINGTMRSATGVHRVTVPQKLLDAEGQYRVCYRVVKHRKPYFTETEEPKEEVFPFDSVPKEGAKAFLIADAHNDTVATVSAAKQFEAKYGEIDFLILAGDNPNDCGKVENILTIYEIAGQVTKGSKPIAYAKGNHDLRGVAAEKMEEYCPCQNGKSYFPWRLGNIWGVSLDCGEDKADSHEEYGHTVCCHQMRLEETEFLKELIRKGDYLEDSIQHRVILSHKPFSLKYPDPFHIEEAIYRQWCKLLKENIAPEIMICGHLHRLDILEVGSEADYLGQPCRIVVGTKPSHDAEGKRHYTGTGFFFSDSGVSFVFIDENGQEFVPCQEK